MYRLESGDWIRRRCGGAYQYAIVYEVRGERAQVLYVGGSLSEQQGTVSLREWEVVPPIPVSHKKMKQFCRYEISYWKLRSGHEYGNLMCPEVCVMTLDDLEAALDRLPENSQDTDAAFWYWGLEEELYRYVRMDRTGEEEESDDGIPDEHNVFRTVWTMLGAKYDQDAEIPLEDCRKEIRVFREEREKPAADRRMTERQMRHFLSCWRSDGKIEAADRQTKRIYRKVVDALAEKSDPEALEKKAYACFGGNSVYKTDWQASHDCLTRLMEIQPGPYYANSLGYIYYYGRVNGGEPEYEKAFRMFSIGAAGGSPESRYKLADLYLEGHGTVKSPETASHLIHEMYRQSLEDIRHGRFCSAFADVAVRQGDLIRTGQDSSVTVPSPDGAYYYYLQAQFAIRMRRLEADFYGDDEVADRIRRSASEVLPLSSYRKKTGRVRIHSLQYLLQYALKRHHFLQMSWKNEPGGAKKIQLKVMPYDGEKYPPKIFLTVPEAHYCGLAESVVVTAKNITFLEINADAPVYFDDIRDSKFLFYGKVVASMNADFFWDAPGENEERYRFAAVTFRPGGETSEFLCDLDVRQGDSVIVRTPGGECVAQVSRVYEKSRSELALPFEKYQRVLRKA